MTKPQMIAMFFAMILTSTLVAAATLAGGVWWVAKSSNILNLENSPIAFLSTKPEEEVEQGPSFHPIEKLVLTVKGKKQTHFVMLELAIETRQPERIKVVDNYMPLIQNSLLKLFSDKSFDQLQQPGAIENLQTEVKNTLLQTFAETPMIRDIDDILMTKYVVQ